MAQIDVARPSGGEGFAPVERRGGEVGRRVEPADAFRTEGLEDTGDVAMRARGIRVGPSCGPTSVSRKSNKSTRPCDSRLTRDLL